MLVAEANRRGIAAVLAADSDRQRGVERPAAFDRDPHQLADALLVERRERIVRQDAILEIAGEELALRVVAREPERRLRQVVRAEREEVGVARRSRPRARMRAGARSSFRRGTGGRSLPRRQFGP